MNKLSCVFVGACSAFFTAYTVGGIIPLWMFGFMASGFFIAIIMSEIIGGVWPRV